MNLSAKSMLEWLKQMCEWGKRTRSCVNQILEQIPSLVETEILDTQTAKLRAYKLRAQISELEAKLATLPPVNLKSVAKLVSIPQFWLDLSESERRFYLREFIQEIEIIRDGKDWNIEVVFIF